jgi:hypothetical protein
MATLEGREYDPFLDAPADHDWPLGRPDGQGYRDQYAAESIPTQRIAAVSDNELANRQYVPPPSSIRTEPMIPEVRRVEAEQVRAEIRRRRRGPIT